MSTKRRSRPKSLQTNTPRREQLPGRSRIRSSNKKKARVYSLLPSPRPLSFHVPEMTAVLAGRNFQRALKDIAHGINVSKAAFGRNRLHAVLTFFQPATRRF